MQQNPNVPYQEYQEPEDTQRAQFQQYPQYQYPVQPMPSYYMPIRPTHPVYYQYPVQQYPPIHFIPQQSLPVGQVINQPPFYQYQAPEPERPVPQGPTLIEMIRSATPEHLYKSALRICTVITSLFLLVLFFKVFSSWTDDDHHGWGGDHHGRRGHWRGMAMFNLALNLGALIAGLRAMKMKNSRKFKKYLKFMGAIFAISAYRLITGILFGMGPKLGPLIFVIQSGYLICKGRRYFRTYFKNDWKEKQNLQEAANEGGNHNSHERINVTPQVVEMQQHNVE